MVSEERFNSISHLGGTILSVLGAAALITAAALKGDPWKITSFSIYGASLVLLYGSSSLYHGARGRSKALFRKFDHSAIYLLIAGSYTPFALVTLRGVWGWSLFGAVWGLAVVGIVIDIFHDDKRRRVVPLVIHVLMGWLVVFAIRPLLRSLPMGGFLWLLGGGLLYTGGILFYVLDKRIPHGHGIWHLFVLAGSATQYVAIYAYVL